jgi:hypothetical protein
MNPALVGAPSVMCSPVVAFVGHCGAPSVIRVKQNGQTEIDGLEQTLNERGAVPAAGGTAAAITAATLNH